MSEKRLRDSDFDRLEDAIELAFERGASEASVRAVIEEAVTRYAAYYAHYANPESA